MMAIKSRIKWCRRLREAARTWEEAEGWRAEEAGLLDAWIGVDRTAITRCCLLYRFPRYQLGLRDGRTLRRVESGE
jgi:hypothetical protein